MSKLFDRFRKKQEPKTPKYSRSIDQPLIGSELFEGRPVSAREYLMPIRKEIQAQYKAEGRDPDSLSKFPADQRDERFWTTYIDSLIVFEQDEKALIYVTDALSRFPNNSQFREMKSLLELRFR